MKSYMGGVVTDLASDVPRKNKLSDDRARHCQNCILTTRDAEPNLNKTIILSMTGKVEWD